MHSEELVEEGIVISAVNGEIDVELISSDECKHCSAKLICKPKDNKSNIIHLVDPIDVKAGDKVKIAVKGSLLFKASLLLYGAPLFLLIVGIIIGLNIFKEYSTVEFYSFILAVVLVGGYFSALFYIPALKDKIQEKPKIIPF